MVDDITLSVAVRAVRRAASVLVDAARDLVRLPAHARNGADLLAAAEAEAENAIVATVRASFPDHAVLGEASGAIAGAREGRGYKWFVDPLDGAANFLRGYPHYAVSVALARGRELALSAVLDPLRDELFIAVRGQGATLNDAPVRMSSCTALEAAVVGTALSDRPAADMARHARVLNALLPKCSGLRRGGACALDLAYVAAGRLDAFCVMGLERWDAAAGALLVKEAGGAVTDFTGGADFLNARDVIAAAPCVFAPLAKAIAAAT